MKNSRTKRKLKAGFKGVGTHKDFYFGKCDTLELEQAKGSYKSELNRDPTGNNRIYANIVKAAVKHCGIGKHIGSKAFRIIKRMANFS